VILLSFVLINTILVLVFAVLTWAFYEFLRPVHRSSLTDQDLPFLSVVVPARNEELKIERCLGSLLKQNYPRYEVVVIDDRSTDATAEIIARIAAGDKRLKFVQGTSLPPGWIGKCNALAHAVPYASGDWLLFTDADTCHNESSLRDSVSHALANQADLVSFVPLQELGSFWEKVVMPVLLGSFLSGDPFHTVNDPGSDRAYAYGQYILVRRPVYKAVGGHQAVRDEIVEDHALGRVVKTAGYRILVADGHDLYRVRMYTNLESLTLGWTKNLYSLIECRPTNLLLILLLINCVTLLPFVQAALVTGIWLHGEPYVYLKEIACLTALGLAALFTTFRRASYHYYGVGPEHFWLLPLGSLAVTALYLQSAYLVVSGGQVNWKGRRYRVNTSKTIAPALRLDRELEPVLDKALAQESLD